MSYEILISFVLASATLAIAPGPDNIFVLIQSITNGKSYGIATVCGLVTGCIIHTSLLAFGVSTLIKANEHIFFIIKVFGALYLLYLAYKVYTSSSAIQLDGNSEKKSLKLLFIQGFFMNVLNPKVSIFFLAFFPGFLFSDTLSEFWQFYVLGGLFMLTSFIVFSLIAIFASPIKILIANNKQSGIFLKWLQIIVFIGIAIFILI